MSYKRVKKKDFKKACELYFSWKELNSAIKKISTRGINLPEAITEIICCYVNKFELSKGEGSEDAIIPRTSEKVQIKATSNFNQDLTSFGPKSEFDYLHFVRLNQKEDKMYLYKIPIEYLEDVKVSKKKTFYEQQKEGKRPRFSIIEKCINKYNIKYYKIVDLEKELNPEKIH